MKTHTLDLFISRRDLRNLEFYAKAYEIPLPHLLESNLYGELAVLGDDVFSWLDWIDRNPADEDVKLVELNFCQAVYDLLRRAADLLHRPVSELAGALLRSSGDSMCSHIQEAFLSNEGLIAPGMEEWADAAARFRRAARRNLAPGWTVGAYSFANGWVALSLEKTKQKKVGVR